MDLLKEDRSDVALKEYHRELVQRLLDGRIQDKDGLQQTKIELCRKHKLKGVPPNSETLALLSGEDLERAEAILQRKPVRTLSGVAVVAVMTSPRAMPARQVHLLPGRRRQRFPAVVHGQGARCAPRCNVRLRPVRTGQGQDRAAEGHRP